MMMMQDDRTAEKSTLCRGEETNELAYHQYYLFIFGLLVAWGYVFETYVYYHDK